MAKKMTRRRKTIYIILISLLVILVAFRIALSYILLRYVNRELARIDGYRGHVEDIDVALFRGAYTIDSIRLDKLDGKIPVPFFAAHKIDLSVEWKAIFEGSVVGEIVVSNPVINFVSGPSKASSQTDIDKDWVDVVDNLMPLKLNRLEINNGKVHYRDYYSSPKVNIAAGNIDILAENLVNTKDKKELLPGTVTGSASVYGGNAKLKMKIDALNKVLTFDANAQLVNVNLKELNSFMQAYGNFDVEAGNMGLYTEAAAKNGRISGYTKPIIKDLQVVSWKEDKDQPVKLIWESVVQAVTWVFKNHRKDQLATRVEFEGDIKNPDINVWYLVGQVLRNAFIQALYPSLENSINIKSTDSKDKKPTKLEKEFEKSKKG